MAITSTATEAARAGGDEIGVADGGRVEGNLVGSGAEHGAHVVFAADATADGERDEDLIGAAPGQVDDGVALLVRSGDVEEDELVRTFPVVVGSQLHRVAGVADVHEVRALDTRLRARPDTG